MSENGANYKEKRRETGQIITFPSGAEKNALDTIGVSA